MGGGLDLLLGISHAVSEARDNLMEAGGNLGGGSLGHTSKEGEGKDLALPVAGLSHGVKESRERVPGGVGVDDGKESLGSLLGSSAGAGGLVRDTLEKVGEEGEEEGL